MSDVYDGHPGRLGCPWFGIHYRVIIDKGEILVVVDHDVCVFVICHGRVDHLVLISGSILSSPTLIYQDQELAEFSGVQGFRQDGTIGESTAWELMVRLIAKYHRLVGISFVPHTIDRGSRICSSYAKSK